MAKYTINRGGKDYTFDSQEKYEEFYNLARETAKRHGTSTADVFKTQYDLYAKNPDTNPSSVGIVPTASPTGGAMTPSANGTWKTQLDDTINKLLNREKFSYDLNGDALYQQYKDKYIQQGKLAMDDAIGQASAMTGGYGNSYAQSVGQQAYQAQLDNLNDMVPEFYQMALDKYNMEGQGLYNQYDMLVEQDNLEYDRYRDEISDWLSYREAMGDYPLDEEDADGGNEPPQYTYEETPAVTSFVARIRTRGEFSRNSDYKQKFTTYENYVKSMLDKYESELTDNDIATISAMFGL